MSVIRKQWLEQYNYSDVQSALMTAFPTDFTSSGRNFCRWVAEAPPRETSLSGDERGETSAARRLEKHAVLIENDQSTQNRSLTYYWSFSFSVRMKRRLCQRQSGGKCPENHAWPPRAHEPCLQVRPILSPGRPFSIAGGKRVGGFCSKHRII